MKMTTKKIATIGVLTALYVILSFCMKFTVIGNIQIDLGYIALAIACGLVGGWAGFVGAVGCGLESLIFSAYGFSISWFVANLIIGIGCGFTFKATKNMWIRIASVIGFVALGVLGAKTIIECNLYQIPFAVKIVKNAVAFGVDTVAMTVGTVLVSKVKAFKKLGLSN